jgi:hypothetical protein
LNVCDTSVNRCIVFCDTNGDCPSGGVCNTNLHECSLSCNTAADCPLSTDKCKSNRCVPAPPGNVNDYSELKLVIKVPTNAKSFHFNFQFLSSEYPTFHCSDYNDTFLAELTSQAVNGGVQQNISFDQNNNVISVNNGFFDICTINDQGNVCDASINANNALAGTGFIPTQPGGSFQNNHDSAGAGATQLLTTTSPVQPGETMTIRYVLFDEGDDILDSEVVLDNFQWDVNPVSGPITQ